jgi:hypothetical protein
MSRTRKHTRKAAVDELRQVQAQFKRVLGLDSKIRKVSRGVVLQGYTPTGVLLLEVTLRYEPSRYEEYEGSRWVSSSQAMFPNNLSKAMDKVLG